MSYAPVHLERFNIDFEIRNKASKTEPSVRQIEPDCYRALFLPHCHRCDDGINEIAVEIN